MTDTGAAWSQGANPTNFQGVSGLSVPFTSTGEADVSPAPNTNCKIQIDDMIVSTDVACNVDIKDTTGNIYHTFQFAGAGSQQITPRNGIKLKVAGDKVRAKYSVAPTKGSVLINGHSVP